MSWKTLLASFLSSVEGTRKDLHYDSNNIPTIGAGINLRSNLLARKDIVEHILSSNGISANNQTQHDFLVDSLAAEVRGTISRNSGVSISVLKSAIESDMSLKVVQILGGTPPSINFTIATDASVQVILLKEINRIETAVPGGNPAIRDHLGEIAGQPGQYTWDRLDDSQKVSIGSLYFNNPVLIPQNGTLHSLLEEPDLNRAAIWYEIRHKTNGANSSGIYNRRYNEAALFGLYDNPANVSDLEAQKIIDFLTPSILQHIQHDEQIQQSVNAATNWNFASDVTSITDNQVSILELFKPIYSQIVLHEIGQEIYDLLAVVSPVGDFAWQLDIDGNDVINGTSQNDILIASQRMNNGELNGGSGNDTLISNDAPQNSTVTTLNGGDGDDNLIGKSGNDELNGGDGEDKLFGGAGNDFLNGGDGSDTYYFGKGSGNDIINDQSTAAAGNKITFLKGVLPTDIEIYRKGEALVLEVLSTGDTLEVNDWFLPGSTTQVKTPSPIQSVTFVDSPSTVWSPMDIETLSNNFYKVIVGTDPNGEIIYGSEGWDLISGTVGNDFIRGYGGNDIISGGGGSDHILGYDGDDKLYAEGVTGDLWGGAGNDLLDASSAEQYQLYGGDGSDTLIAGSVGTELLGGLGSDIYVVNADSRDTTIFDESNTSSSVQALDLDLAYSGSRLPLVKSADFSTETDINVVKFGVGISLDDLQFSTTHFTYAPSYFRYLNIDGVDGFSLRIEFWFADVETSNLNPFGPIQQFEFSDGSELTIDDITYHLLNKIGTDKNDSIGGDRLGQTLSGLSGNDVINARDGDDILIGGTGNDILIGDYGSDTYIFNAGDGHDEIRDYARADDTNTVQFGEGIEPADLHFAIYQEHDLRIFGFNTTDSLVISNWFGNSIERVETGYGSITRFEFSNGSSLSRNDIYSSLGLLVPGDAFVGTEENDDLIGTNRDDVILGKEGNDTLNGLDGSDTLNGGLGDDFLSGAEGDDTYFYSLSDGNDIIEDNAGTNTLNLQNINQADVEVSRLNDSLIITILSNNETITLSKWFEDSSNRLNVQFDDIYLTASSVENMLPLNVINGTQGDDILNGTGLGDEINGLAGDDVLKGEQGNDTLTGGTGEDSILGGDGDDSYHYQLGDGNDVITETEGTDALNLNGINQADVSFRKSTDDLVVTTTANNQTITIKDWFVSTDNQIESIQLADATLNISQIEALIPSVNAPPEAPIVNDINVTQGQILNDFALPEFVDNDPLTYELLYEGSTNLPVGLTFDPLTHSLSGEIVGSGDYQFAYKATDPSNETDSVTFTLNAAVDAAHASAVDITISVDDKEEVYFNGALLGESHQAHAWRTASKYVVNRQEGANVLSIKATDTGGIAGLIAQLEADGQTLYSNGTWKVSTTYQEGWQDVGFDDSNWVEATTHGVYGDTPWDKNVSGLSSSSQSNWIWSSDNNADNEVYFRYEIDYTKAIEPSIINGTSSDNVIVGTDQADEINGLGGNDQLSGLGGNDTLNGGEGNDTYFYSLSDGNDIIEDNVGTNTLNLQNINQADVEVSRINDSLIITILSNNETITLSKWFEDSSNRLNVQFDDIFLTASSVENMLPLNVINGTEGDDILNGTDLGDEINGNGGSDTINALAGDDYISVDETGNFVDGGEGDDDIYAYDGDNEIIGGSGDDEISVDEGYNIVDGGEGDDEIDAYEGNSEVIGGTGDDDIYVDGGLNSVDGGEGHDEIDAYDGNSEVTGGLGDDDIYVDGGHNFVDAGEGDDYVEAYDGGNIIDGGDGSDDIEAYGGNNEINSGLGDDYVEAYDGGNIIDGGDGSDDIEAYGGNNIINGGNGNDRLYSGAGADQLLGGQGDDTYDYYLNSGNDIITESEGADTLHLNNISQADVSFSQSTDDLVVTTTANSQTITIEDWFVSTDNQIESIQLADITLNVSQIEALIPSVNTPPEAPIVNDINVTQGQILDDFSLPEFADNDPLTYELLYEGSSNLPVGLTFDPTTHSLSGEIVGSGDYQFTYKATDPSNETDTVSFTLNAAVDASHASAVDITISVDDKEEVYFNGALLGESHQAHAWRTASNYVVNRQEGSNVLAVKAIDTGGVAGLIAQLQADGQTINSNGKWKVSTTFQEGWQDADFDDSTWVEATTHGMYGDTPWNKNVSGLSSSSTANWIWSSDNNADNEVYFRYEIDYTKAIEPLIMSAKSFNNVLVDTDQSDEMSWLDDNNNAAVTDFSNVNISEQATTNPNLSNQMESLGGIFIPEFNVESEVELGKKINQNGINTKWEKLQAKMTEFMDDGNNVDNSQTNLNETNYSQETELNFSKLVESIGDFSTDTPESMDVSVGVSNKVRVLEDNTSFL